MRHYILFFPPFMNATFLFPPPKVAFPFQSLATFQKSFPLRLPENVPLTARNVFPLWLYQGKVPGFSFFSRLATSFRLRPPPSRALFWPLKLAPLQAKSDSTSLLLLNHGRAFFLMFYPPFQRPTGAALLLLTIGLIFSDSLFFLLSSTMSVPFSYKRLYPFAIELGQSPLLSLQEWKTIVPFS